MNITFSDDLLSRLKFEKLIIEQSVNGTGTVYLPVPWYYNIWMIGAGGGAGGGSWGSGHKTTGDGGGGGSAFIGTVFLSAGSYTYLCGKGGGGGSAARRVPATGHDGSNTTLVFNGSTIIRAGSGAGGPAGRRSSSVTPEGSPVGRGGILTFSPAIQIASVILQTNGRNGGSDGDENHGGASFYQGYGKGGDGQYKSGGKSGSDGYIRIEMV